MTAATTPALMTDEAVRSVTRVNGTEIEEGHGPLSDRERIAVLLHHHATEGRAALVETVFRALVAETVTLADAEAVVTALVGGERA